LLGEPIFKNRQLDYIQINTPIEFLPQGVSIVDTPGLGALYKSHEFITQQYIRNAAAVVFIFDPSQPMVQQEKMFLEKVFSVTPYVMFVMTKVDNFDENVWVTQISRTETLLKDAFGSRCYTLPKVFPVASATLLGASKETDQDAKEESVEFSYFPAAYNELLKVIYKTVGLSRTRFAWNEAANQKAKVLLSIDDQQKILVASTQEEQEKIKEKKALIKQSFEQIWGPSSKKRKEVAHEVQNIITGVHNRSVQLTSTTGIIYKKYLLQIEELNSLDSIKAFADKFSKNILSEVAAEWQLITSSAQKEVITTLNIVQSEIDKISSQTALTESGSPDVVELSFGEKFQSYKSRYFDAAITTSIGGTLLTMAGVGAFIPPLLPVIIIATVVFGFIFGSNDAEKKEIEKNKTNLKNHLNTLMNEVNAQLFHTPVAGGHKSMVQSFTSELSGTVDKAIEAMFLKQKNDFDTEQKRLEEQGRLGMEQRQKELIRINDQRKRWIEIASQIDKEKSLLDEIQTALN
jgi:large-conductance mechanosensitive channel